MLSRIIDYSSLHGTHVRLPGVFFVSLFNDGDYRSFQIDGSLLCLSEVSNMTLSSSPTSDECSLTRLRCILSKSDFQVFRASIFFSIIFSLK